MFKLLEIEFINHPFFGSLLVKFVGEGEENAENYTTLIISPNGTGKSKILLAIISIFNSLELATNNPKIKYRFAFKYKLIVIYQSNVHIIDYSRSPLLIDEMDYSTLYNSSFLPKKVIISAFSFNDKYPLRQSKGKIINENYHYLGLKSTTNNIFIGNPTKNAIQNLHNAVLNKKDITPLREAFTTLELKPELKLVYKSGKYFKFLQNNDFWENKKLSYSQFSEAFSEFVKKKKKKTKNPEIKRLGTNKIEKLLEDKDKISTVIKFLNDNIRLMTSLEKQELSFKPFLDFD